MSTGRMLVQARLVVLDASVCVCLLAICSWFNHAAQTASASSRGGQEETCTRRCRRFIGGSGAM